MNILTLCRNVLNDVSKNPYITNDEIVKKYDLAKKQHAQKIISTLEKNKFITRILDDGGKRIIVRNIKTFDGVHNCVECPYRYWHEIAQGEFWCKITGKFVFHDFDTRLIINRNDCPLS